MTPSEVSDLFGTAAVRSSVILMSRGERGCFLWQDGARGHSTVQILGADCRDEDR